LKKVKRKFGFFRFLGFRYNFQVLV